MSSEAQPDPGFPPDPFSKPANESQHPPGSGKGSRQAQKVAPEEKPAPIGSLMILGIVALVGVFVVWKQFFSAPKVSASASRTPHKAAKPGAGKPGEGGREAAASQAARELLSQEDSAAGSTATGSAGKEAGAGKDSAAAARQSVTRWSVREEEDSEGFSDPESYAFARVAWENPESKALETRVRRLGDGFDLRPMGRFRAVAGRQVFLRQSFPVNFAADRKLDRIPESALAEYLPEWYQRGFIMHFRGHREAFMPRTFRLKPPRQSMAAGGPGQGEAKDSLMKYSVYAYVERPEALLIYPDPGREKGEGANGFVAAEDLRSAPPEGGFGLDYFRRLTGGRVDSLRAYALADRGFIVLEAHARRAPPGASPDGKMPARRGAYTFLVKPGERRIAFLVHDFDARACGRRNDIRFLGMLDVDGDETPELWLGPHPAILVHEDAEGIKYHYEAGEAGEAGRESRPCEEGRLSLSGK